MLSKLAQAQATTIVFPILLLPEGTTYHTHNTTTHRPRYISIIGMQFNAVALGSSLKKLCSLASFAVNHALQSYRNIPFNKSTTFRTTLASPPVPPTLPQSRCSSNDAILHGYVEISDQLILVLFKYFDNIFTSEGVGPPNVLKINDN